jgi:uncharacterized protein YciI
MRLPEKVEPLIDSHVSTFVFRLIAPRQTFALDMTEAEREITGRQAAYWQPFVDSGQMVAFGPVLGATGSSGLAVIEADDEEALRAFAEGDPVVTSGTAEMQLGNMLQGSSAPVPRAGTAPRPALTSPLPSVDAPP